MRSSARFTRSTRENFFPGRRTTFSGRSVLFHPRTISPRPSSLSFIALISKLRRRCLDDRACSGQDTAVRIRLYRAWRRFERARLAHGRPPIPGVRDDRVIEFPAPFHLRARKRQHRSGMAGARRKIVARKPPDAAQERQRDLAAGHNFHFRQTAVRDHQPAAACGEIGERPLRDFRPPAFSTQSESSSGGNGRAFEDFEVPVVPPLSDEGGSAPQESRMTRDPHRRKREMHPQPVIQRMVLDRRVDLHPFHAGKDRHPGGDRNARPAAKNGASGPASIQPGG